MKRPFFYFRKYIIKVMTAKETGKTITPLLLSTAYFPSISYFALIKKYPVIIEQYETYPKQTYRNRCKIYTDKGPMRLTVPVKKPNGNKSKTNEILIYNDEKWFLNHWKTIKSAYESSPYFLYYKDDLKDIFLHRFKLLLELNAAILNKISEILDIKPTITYTNNFEKAPDNIIDMRNYFHPKNSIKENEQPKYEQVFSERHGFIPDLSILDLLFNLGPETNKYLSDLMTDNIFYKPENF